MSLVYGKLMLHHAIGVINAAVYRERSLSGKSEANSSCRSTYEARSMGFLTTHLMHSALLTEIFVQFHLLLLEGLSAVQLLGTALLKRPKLIRPYAEAESSSGPVRVVGNQLGKSKQGRFDALVHSARTFELRGDDGALKKEKHS